MLPVLEAVPNFSEGRDLALIEEIARIIERQGAEVLDWTADPDHDRSVITVIGTPAQVAQGVLAGARFAVEHIDLRNHAGVHPRLGALDVLPFVPLAGMELSEAVSLARQVGAKLTELGVPVYFYREASQPPGRTLHEVRRGGFEAIRCGFPEGREPDLLPHSGDSGRPHPTAGATCVGVRPVLLAWNVFVRDLAMEELRGIASALREAGGGFPGLRALALELPSVGRRQISMNLEDLCRTSPFEVFRAIEERVSEEGGTIEETEVIGMIPNELLLEAAQNRLRLKDGRLDPIQAYSLSRKKSSRRSMWVDELLSVLRNHENALPKDVREVARRVAESRSGGSTCVDEVMKTER